MEKYRLVITSKTLMITEKFAKKMNDPESEEYRLVKRFSDDFPGLVIMRETHKSPTRYQTKSGERYSCNQFKNLTYERMEKFIAGIPQNEGLKREYSLIRYYAGEVQHNRYALVRKWFVEQFPEFRKNPLYYFNNTPDIVPAMSVIKKDNEAVA